MCIRDRLQGGAYLTQNALASITLEDATDTVSIDMVKQGSYDKSEMCIRDSINGLSYSKFMYGLKLAEVDLNRKVLSEMAINDAEGFAKLAELAKSKIA